MTETHTDAAPIAITPYLCVKDAARAIAFYAQAFGAVEVQRIAAPNDRIGHAELRIADAPIYLADEFPEIGVLSPATIGGSPVLLHLAVPDVDAWFVRALAAGATVQRPLAGQGHGHRNGKLTDPFGHTWMLSSFTAEAPAN